MDIESGKPVLVEELVERGSEFAGQTVRIAGTLHSYNAVADRASLADGQFLVLIDTQLLGVMQFQLGQTYQFIGTVAPTDGALETAPADLFDDARFSLTMVLRARMAREVDGLDMAVYRKSVAALRGLLDATKEGSSSPVGKQNRD